MVSTVELVHRLANLVRAKNSTTFFLNGAPGSGKSYLLSQLAEQLPAEIPHGLMLGPYGVVGPEIAALGNRLMLDCRDAGFLDESPPTDQGWDLVGAWRWLGKNAHIPPGQSFLVLIDLVEPIQHYLTTCANLFSAVRNLEGTWSRHDVHVFHMCVGYWDPVGLERYFDSVNTSFPYTVGHNYIVRNGLSREEMITLVSQTRQEETTSLHGQVLYELTGGHPAAALEILSQIEPGNLSLSALLLSTHQAAGGGAAGQALLNAWRHLPAESKSVLRTLVVKRRIPATTHPSHLERLSASGVARVDRVGMSRYLGFRSWYAELLARLHAPELGIADERTGSIRIDELMPETLELNVEAYRLINDIENQARNFVAVHLCMHQTPGQPILRGRCKKFNEYKNALVDAHQRATDWRTRSTERGLPTALNPLLAYLSTRDLADLITEIGEEIGSEAWQRIGRAIQDLAGVRDAVMHNQFIGDGALQRLYDLQSDVYGALAETD